MNKLHKLLQLLSRIFIGVIFTYSGFVKLVDPLGSTYKFTDYFTAFGTDWAIPFAFSLGIILAISEFLIGITMLLNIKPKLSYLGALLMMIIFTPLTLYLAFANPVHDCGCFGDALVLTNWETFWKNVIILMPVIYLFARRKKNKGALSSFEQWIGVFAILAFSGFIIKQAYNHLPQLDFRPYKVGTHIPDGMIVPDGAPADVWESIFIYEKDGAQQEFGMTNLPDSTWAFISADHKLVKKGYEPPIHDFTINATDGSEITDIVLASENYNFLLIGYDIDKMSREADDKINTIAEFAYENGYPFYGLTASPDDIVNEYLESTSAFYEFYNTDEITLKTIVRSNPGLVLIKEGTIIDKWHFNDFPDKEQLSNELLSQSITKYKKNADTYYIWMLILGAGLLICLYLLIRKVAQAK